MSLTVALVVSLVIAGLVAIVLAQIVSQHRLVTGDRVKITPPPQPRQQKRDEAKGSADEVPLTSAGTPSSEEASP